VTVFAKCHHGQSYAPTKIGTVHPAIDESDILGEQIEALQRCGIAAPVYTTVVWEEDVARKYPEWRQLTKEGSFAGGDLGPDQKPGHVSMWKFNNFIHPDYQDYFESHIRELLERYGEEVDGFFIDIVFLHPDTGYSEASMAYRERHGFTGDDRNTFCRFEDNAKAAFAKRFTSLIHSRYPIRQLRGL
jgi:hypothetical protein